MPGSGSFRFRVPVQDNEEVTQNNQRDVLIDVYDTRSGSSSSKASRGPEPKFVRQATDGDPELQVVAAAADGGGDRQRAGQVLRLGVEQARGTAERISGDAGGAVQVPRLILGSVEAAAFTPDQQRMLEDFVDVRGGGLLMLGGAARVQRGRMGGHAALERAAGRARLRQHEPDLIRRSNWSCGRPAPGQSHSGDPADRRHRRWRPTAKWKDAAAALRRQRACRRPRSSRAPPAVERYRPARPASRSCWPISDTAAARRSRCRCRTPGCGACTPRWPSRTMTHSQLLAAPGALAGRRRARTVMVSAGAGPRAARRAGLAHRRGGRTRSIKGVNDGGSSRTSRRRPGRSRTCRWSGRSSRTASTAARSRRAKTACIASPLTAGTSRDGHDVGRGARDGARGAERRGVLRRGDARAAADAARGGNRGPVLPRMPRPPAWPTPSATAAAASPSSRSANSGTCRSCSCCCWG